MFRGWSTGGLIHHLKNKHSLENRDAQKRSPDDTDSEFFVKKKKSVQQKKKIPS